MDEMKVIEDLRKRVDRAKIEAAKAEERAKRAKADYDAVVKEMAAQGVTEETIGAEIERLEQELKDEVVKVKGALDKVEAMVKDGGKDAGNAEAKIEDLGF